MIHRKIQFEIGTRLSSSRATAARNHALASAQREIDDDNQSESDDSLSGQCDRYQIIESSLLGNGDYEIDKRR